MIHGKKDEVVPVNYSKKVLKIFKKPYKPYIIGKIKKGNKFIQINEKIKW